MTSEMICGNLHRSQAKATYEHFHVLAHAYGIDTVAAQAWLSQLIQSKY